MRKYTYWLLIGALIFIIVQDPTSTGDLIRDFFSWIGNGISAMFEFIARVLGQETGSTTVIPPGPTPSVVDPTAGDQALGHVLSTLT